MMLRENADVRGIGPANSLGCTYVAISGASAPTRRPLRGPLPAVPAIANRIQSIISIANADAITGINNPTTGLNYGIFGRTSSAQANTAGVYGNDRGTGSKPLSYVPSGVLGFSSTLSPGTGVQGIAYYQGVAGSLLNSVGSEIAYGILGFQSGPFTYAVFAGGNYGGNGAKFFIEPHPTDASKVIRYVSLEGPEAGTYFRGRGKFQNGLATIVVQRPGFKARKLEIEVVGGESKRIEVSLEN